MFKKARHVSSVKINTSHEPRAVYLQRATNTIAVHDFLDIVKLSRRYSPPEGSVLLQARYCVLW